MSPEPPTHPEEIVIPSSTGLMDHSAGDSPVGAVPERRAGEEQEFEIAPGVKVVMCWIPPGEFLMGSPEGEYIPFNWDPEYPYEHETSHERETPHHVTITQGFWLGKYQVTQAQWEAVMGSNPSIFKGSNLPVETVSREDISNPGGFIEKANCFAAAKEIFALPTEAQWEYACRAGTWTSLNNGKNVSRTIPPGCPNLNEVAWFGGNSCEKSHPVGQKKPNAWGLHDMHGNVWEWCIDIYEDYPTGPLVDPRVEYSGIRSDFRVLRGGSWSGIWPSDIADCRSARRCVEFQKTRNSNVGFRIARISRPPCVQKSDDVEVCVVEDAEPQPLTFTENSHIITPLTTLESFPKVISPDCTRLSLTHIQTSHAPAVSERLAGEEQEFEISPGVKIVMCWIPPGVFLMGSPENAVGRAKSETQHRVTITEGFWLGKYQVTQAQWQTVMGSQPSRFKGADLPVEQVSWNDISEPGGFIEKLNGISTAGGNFYLPTEAQWEYACRPARGSGPGPKLYEIAWYSQNSDGRTQPVGQKQANDWGIHDMKGNVAEWCIDWYDDYTDALQVDPQGPNSGSERVFRGGFWCARPEHCMRRAIRYKGDPATTCEWLGFRVARSSAPLRVRQSDDVEACAAEDSRFNSSPTYQSTIKQVTEDAASVAPKAVPSGTVTIEEAKPENEVEEQVEYSDPSGYIRETLESSKVNLGAPPINANSRHYRIDNGIYVSDNSLRIIYVTDQAIDDELAKHEGDVWKALEALGEKIAALGGHHDIDM